MVGWVLGTLLSIFWWVLIARVVMDWATVLAGPPNYDSARAKITAFLHRVTEPVLAPVRRVLPPLRIGAVGIDLAFIVVLIGISILRALLFRL